MHGAPAMLVAVAATATPAGAATPSSPPTTVSPAEFGHHAISTLTPVWVILGVLAGLSLIVSEAERSRRRPRASRRARGIRGQTTPRRVLPPSKPAPRPAEHRPIAPARPQRDEPMSARRPGQHVAERIALLDAELASWKRGAAGEQMIGDELDGLDSREWRVFHSLPRGASGTDIDHLVIGVGGVYTVNAKNVAANVWVAKRTLMVGGAKTNYFPVATHEARDTTRRLRCRLPAYPVLAFTGPITVKAMPTDVAVLQAGSVRAWLERRPRVLTPSEMHEIARLADRASTWA